MVQMSRKELYDLVWSVPMSVLCKRFGLSDNGLRKRCKAMNIPMPSLGYWAKRQNGKKTETVPLPPDYPKGKGSTVLREKGEDNPKVDLYPETDRWKLREQEIRAGDTSVFVVPEVLYAKDPLIIDTKEKLRVPSHNQYLRKNPYKSKVNATFQVDVSPLIAELEIRAEIIQEEKLEAERRRIREEEERRKREEFRAERQKEIGKFNSLLEKAERLHQANILREYVGKYEEYLAKEGEITEEMADYIQWAKGKIEWLDPFIAKPDLYLDTWEQEEVRVNTSLSYSQRRENEDSSTGYSFWRKPYWRRK